MPADLQLYRALWCIERGQPDEARRLLEAADAASLLVAQKSMIAAALLSLDLDELRKSPDREMREVLRGRARELAVGPGEATARSWAWQVAAQVAGTIDESLDAYRSAFAVDPWGPGAPLGMAQLLVRAEAAGYFQGADAARNALEEAVKAARAVIDLEGRGPTPPSDRDIELALDLLDAAEEKLEDQGR